MALLLIKQIDRSIFSLNDFVYGIYFDDVDKKSASPHTRWARGQHQMLPITAYESPEKPLLPETLHRDKITFNQQCHDVFEKLRQGSVVLLSVDEYDAVITAVSRVNPIYAKMIERETAKWRAF